MKIQKADAAYPFPPIQGGKGGGGSSGGGGSTQTVQKADPWSGQQPYLTDVFQKAQDQYNVGPTRFYPGQTYADQSPETLAALAAQTGRAIGGSPLLGAAQGEITRTMRGDYLDPNSNPYLQAGFDKIKANILPQIDARFEASGRSMSPLAMRAASEGLSDSMGALALQNYMGERTNQMRGAMFAPQLAQQDYADIARLAEVGSAREDLQQQAINDAMARYNYEQSEPWQRLGQYSNLVQGQYGAQSQTTQSLPRRSIGAGMLGGGIGGGALGYMLGGGDPMYAAAGAGAGGLLGLF